MNLTERIKVVIQGTEYLIKTNSGKEFFISFMHKKDNEIVDGLTNEDIVTILIHRMEQQSSVKSDMWSNKAIHFLREARRMIEERSFQMKNYKYKKKILNNE